MLDCKGDPNSTSCSSPERFTIRPYKRISPVRTHFAHTRKRAKAFETRMDVQELHAFVAKLVFIRGCYTRK